jgi:uncharacterized protein (TIGR02996 family)
MRTFTFSDGKANKFWNIELQETQFTVTYGRAGTQGQTQTKTFATAAKAQAAHDKLVKEKLAKGYVETTPATPTTLEGAMEQQLQEDPDDVATLSAYADRLSEQGDPRGEFIQVQLALEQEGRSPDQRQPLQKREKELLAQHGREWLGELAPYLLDQQGVREYIRKDIVLGGEGGYRFQFARGRLHSLTVPELTVAFARLLAKAPLARSLRRLEIHGTAYEDQGSYEGGNDVPPRVDFSPSPYPLLRAPFLGSLRVFHLGEPETDDDHPRCQAYAEPAADLVEKMPYLEELYLLAHGVDTNKLFALKNLTNLRVLQVYHLNDYPLDILAANSSLGCLTHLLLHPHALEPGDAGAYLSLDAVRELVRSPYLRKLTHLQLRLSDLGDDGCEEIVRSGILRRLKVLDLMHGSITDQGARILAACPDLRNLERLDISNNQLSEGGVAALRATGIQVVSTSQHGEDDEEYLYAGDWE